MSNSIIVLLGAGATGKDTTLNILKQKYSNLQTCVSHTTRPPRATEIEGREYFFVDNAEFEAMYNNGEFIETRSYNVVRQNVAKSEEGWAVDDEPNKETWHYGMSEKEVTTKLDKGHIIMILDLQGLMELKDYYQNSETDIHAFYINVDEDTRIQRYLKRDNITLEMVQEMVRRIEADSRDFIGVENHATIINNPPTSEMGAYTIENYLINRGINLK